MDRSGAVVKALKAERDFLFDSRSESTSSSIEVFISFKDKCRGLINWIVTV